MKKILFCLACLLFAGSAYAQTTDAAADQGDANKVLYGGEVLTLDVAPTFKKGGFEKYCNWLLNRVKYPTELQGKSSKLEGTVNVRIVVELDGSVTVAEVIDSPHQAMTDEVVSTINSSPKWKPGMIKDAATGKLVPIRVAYKIPIFFKERVVPPTLNNSKVQVQRMNTNIRTYGSSD